MTDKKKMEMRGGMLDIYIESMLISFKKNPLFSSVYRNNGIDDYHFKDFWPPILDGFICKYQLVGIKTLGGLSCKEGAFILENYINMIIKAFYAAFHINEIQKKITTKENLELIDLINKSVKEFNDIINKS